MKPIIFNTPMVRAILDGHKTMTRRIIKPQPTIDDENMWHWKDCQWMDGGLGMPESAVRDYAPYKHGEVLWVRETWGTYTKDWADSDRILYRADYPEGASGYWFEPRHIWCELPKWRPSIHMACEDARIFLRVTDVRAERAQEIKAEDIQKEGGTSMAVHCKDYEIAVKEWQILWDNLYSKRGYGWAANPWVWVFEFEQISKEEAEQCQDK